MDRHSCLNLQILEQCVSIGATERDCSTHGKDQKVSKLQSGRVPLMHHQGACQVLVGVVDVESHLKFSRKWFSHDSHLLQVKKKVNYFPSQSLADKNKC